MSRKDRINAEINWLKMWVTLLLTAFFAVAGWVFTHYVTATKTQLVLAGVALVAMAAGLVGLNQMAKKFMDELEELE